MRTNQAVLNSFKALSPTITFICLELKSTVLKTKQLIVISVSGQQLYLHNGNKLLLVLHLFTFGMQRGEDIGLEEKPPILMKKFIE